MTYRQRLTIERAMRLRLKAKHADELARIALRAALPNGMQVTYRWGESRHEALVLGVSGDRVLLRNVWTGRSRWVGAHLIEPFASMHERRAS